VRDANHRRVWAALSTVLLAGPALADRLRGARAALEGSPDRQVVILVASSGGRGRGGGAYHGLYAVVEEAGGAAPASSVLAVRIHGSGPPVLTTAMVTTLFKFDTAARELREVGSSHTFTFTTDAVGVDAAHLGGGR
jgi:NADH:ubiquinone oxidoreductase subunit F (NADH-binding)